MTLPKYKNLSKSQALSLSWKDRISYTHGLAGTKFHNSWRARVFTIKGKRAGFDPRWEKFQNFIEDMYASYKEGYKLSRKDKSKPFSKENCEWISPSKLSEYKYSKLEYNDETKTIIEWCLQYDLNYNGVRQRYYKGKKYTAKEILFGKVKNKKKNLLDIQNLSYQRLCSKASKMISAYKCKDKKRGVDICDFTVEWMIDNILNKSCSYCDSTKNIGADRQNNSLGHLKINVIPCCISCNSIKGDKFNYEQMRKIGQFIKHNIY